MRIAYCDCFSGISGDMFLAGLIDAGLPIEKLIEELGKVGFSEAFELSVIPVHKGAIQACLLNIQFEESQGHRNLDDIRQLLMTSSLAPGVIERAHTIFQALAEAEAKVHGTTIEAVHFHEVGALDSIIDIVGAAIGLEYFEIEQLYASALPVGNGQIKTDHGLIPLPAPATLELMRKGKMTIVPSSATKELVTPTGAAILAAFAISRQPTMRIDNIGIGAGKRDLPWPNILRLIIGEGELGNISAEMVMLETNIDDMNPQLFAPVQTRLFKAGALDVFFSSIFMKKNRPATMVSVIARKKDEAVLARMLLRETNTFGVRVSPIMRYEADRQFAQVSTRYGDIQVKVKILDGKPIMAMPEYEDCLKRAEETCAPVIDVYQAAIVAAQAIILR